MTDTRRKVKLLAHYPRNPVWQWDELGAGYVSFYCIPEDLNMNNLLWVKTESDRSLLLSPIQPDKKYQKDVDILTWFEADSIYMALYFHDKADCCQIWEKICQVTGMDPSLEITQDIVEMENSEDERFDDMSDSKPFYLPPFNVGRLEDINMVLKSCITSPTRREKLLVSLNSDDYFSKNEMIRVYFSNKESDEMDHDLNDMVRNLILIKSHLVLISTLHKNASATSQIELLLHQLNLN